MSEVAAATEVVDDGGRHDGHDLGGLDTDRKADASRFEPRHDAARRRESVRTATRQAHGVHVVDEVVGPQQVGLVSARSAAAHIDATHGAVARHDHRCAGSPARTSGFARDRRRCRARR